MTTYVLLYAGCNSKVLPTSLNVFIVLHMVKETASCCFNPAKFLRDLQVHGGIAARFERMCASE